MCKKLLVLVLVPGLANLASAALVGEWNFDSVSGNIITDTAGWAQNGTLYGDVSIVYDGSTVFSPDLAEMRWHNFGYVAVTNGQLGAVPDYMNCGGGGGSAKNPKWPDARDFTVAFWVKLGVSQDDWWEPAERYTTASGYIMEIDTSTIYWKGYYDGPYSPGYITCNNTINDGKWHHLAATTAEVGDDIVTAIYVDGTLAASGLYVGGVSGRLWNGQDVHFLGSMKYPNDSGAVTMDDCRFYGNALNQEEVEMAAYDSPEPATLALLGLGAVILGRRRQIME
jgi:hypothetical protein